MKKSTLSLSLLMGAALTIPSLAMAAPTASEAVEDAATATTLEAEGTPTNEAAADHSNPFQLSETQTIKRAQVNNLASQQPMTTELQAEQATIQNTMQEDMQAQQAAIQNPEAAMQQQAMQDDEAAMQQQDLQQAMLDEEAALQEEALSENEEDAEPTQAL
ncbi:MULTISPECIES: hypothetical protein [Psychrobacter]|uniref:hypothetical protein n=1 Tax=Psychrobacter TaxID=497 RepID=UPI0018DF40C1|nr:MULTISPECIES: hypothetical protein [Psychrobacter]WLW66502.1 hypothetical protein RAH45_00760 [Psychrobacter sp. van23A]